MSSHCHSPVALETIAALCDGELVGSPLATVVRVAGVDNATPDSLIFITDAFAATLGRSKEKIPDEPGVVLISPDHRDLFAGNRILVADPYLAYAQVSGLFAATRQALPGSIHSTAIIDPSAVLGKNVSVGAHSVVGANSVIGNEVTIGAQVVIENDCRIGNHTKIESMVMLGANSQLGLRCGISSGAVIGASGFGYAPSATGWIKIHQLGGVVIGNDVDIGANTTIDRGTIDNTVIGDRVKLDNLIQIAHNVRIGDDTIMAACVGIAGSTVIGDRCQIGGRSNINGHIKIVDDVIVTACTFITRSINDAGTYSSGFPARPTKQWRKTVAHFNRLEKIVEKLNKIGNK